MAEGPVYLHVGMDLRPGDVGSWWEKRRHLEPAHEANGLHQHGAYASVFGRAGHVTALYRMADADVYARAGVELRQDEDYVRWGTEIHRMIRDEHVAVVRPLAADLEQPVSGRSYVRVTAQLALDRSAAYEEVQGQLAPLYRAVGVRHRGAFSPLFGRMGSVVSLYEVADAGAFDRATTDLAADPVHAGLLDRWHDLATDQTVELVRAL